MKSSISSLKSGILVSLASVLATACATGGGTPSDKIAAERSKAYIQGLSYVLAGKAGGICALPTTAQKVALSSSDAPSKEWKDLLSKASACAGDKNWKTLEPVAQALARIDINAPWGAYFMSVSAEGTGDWQRALWMVELAQKKAGVANGLFLYQHGRIWAGLKETTKAMSDVQKAVSLEPKLVAGHLFLAEIHHRDLEWDQAAEHYASVLSVEAENPQALAGLGDVRINQNRASDAAELYTKAISAQSSRLEWWLRLGSIYETNLKNNELALSTYKGLRTSLDKGEVKQRPSIDLQAKIKALEDAVVSARQPAQATVSSAAVKPDQLRSKK